MELNLVHTLLSLRQLPFHTLHLAHLNLSLNFFCLCLWFWSFVTFVTVKIWVWFTVFRFGFFASCVIRTITDALTFIWIFSILFVFLFLLWRFLMVAALVKQANRSSMMSTVAFMVPTLTNDYDNKWIRSNHYRIISKFKE